MHGGKHEGSRWGDDGRARSEDGQDGCRGYSRLAGLTSGELALQAQPLPRLHPPIYIGLV
jgi:hypothetical protein